MTFVRGLSITLTLGNFLSLAAQARLDSMRVDGRRIREGLDSLTIFVLRGDDTVRTGRIWDEIQASAGEILRTYRSTDDVLGNRLDTIIDRTADLRPVAYRSRTSRSNTHLDFNTTSIKGWVIEDSGDSVPIRVHLSRPVYNAASFDLLLRAADLQTGLRFSIPAFVAETKSVVQLRGHVGGVESVSGRACWVVEADFGGLPTILWIEQATRALRRQLIRPPGGTSVLFMAF